MALGSAKDDGPQPLPVYLSRGAEHLLTEGIHHFNAI